MGGEAKVREQQEREQAEAFKAMQERMANHIQPQLVPVTHSFEHVQVTNNEGISEMWVAMTLYTPIGPVTTFWSARGLMLFADDAFDSAKKAKDAPLIAEKPQLIVPGQ